MDSLPQELFDVIIKFISSAEKPTRTFRSLRAVNKALHQLFTPLSFPSTIVRNTQQSASNFKSLLESPLAVYVKELTVHQHKPLKEQHPNRYESTPPDPPPTILLDFSLSSLSSLTTLTLKFPYIINPSYRSINTTFQHTILSLCSTSSLPSLRCLTIRNLLISPLLASWPTSAYKLASALTHFNLFIGCHPDDPDDSFGEKLLQQLLEPARESLISLHIKNHEETLNYFPPALGWMQFPRLERLELNQVVVYPHGKVLKLIQGHSATLQTLVLLECTVDNEYENDYDGNPMMIREFSWADVWRILETELASLVELRTTRLMAMMEYYILGESYHEYVHPNDKDREALKSIMGVVEKRKKAGELGKLRTEVL